MLSGDQLSVSLGRAPVLHDVSIRVAPGELVALVGPNGAGKSTLMRTLAGELAPTRGQVTLDGESIGRLPAPELARRRAVMSQSSRVGFDFSARAIIGLGRHPYTPSPRDAELVEAAAETAEVTHLLDRPYPRMSGGEQQRVQLARALAQLGISDRLVERPASERTRVLLLDEPTSSLDPGHKHTCLSTVRRLAQSFDLAVVAVLHSLPLATYYADRLVVLKEGRVLGDGSPLEAVDGRWLEQAYAIGLRVLERGERPLVAVTPPGALEAWPKRRERISREVVLWQGA